ncbi:MAG TPA: chromate resistance protein ChrB domain-containing protein [Acidimicrobiales bacterium]|nr:chromate resistance protein ChrB domain-containing protein [Acidimicrobiales bacterium]
MRWATRSGVHVDRAACAWLIRRFIDPDGAVFVFVDDPSDVPDDATAFDVRGVELSHHGGDCSFETMLHHFSLEDPVLWDLARLVHEADLADDRFDAPEAAGLDVVCRGLSMVTGDETILELTGPVFDGLYEYRRRALMLGHEPA